VIVVSNQRGIALGRVTTMQVECVHEKMQDHLVRNDARLDAIFYCPHDYGECHCRKPDTGLFEQAFQSFPQANAENSIVIGDSLSDIQAGRRLDMKTIFIQGEPDRQKEGADAAATVADAVAGSLLQAVEAHLGLTAPSGRATGVEQA
jgi:D-glycero-D-manno-heptose 1,7-bisphosphate phosphatase